MAKKLVFLKTQADFDQFRKSTNVLGKVLRVKVRHNTNQNQPRFGFIVPKKVLPKVVDRNRIKRRLKALLLKHQPEVAPRDYLIFPSKNALTTKFPVLEEELVKLLTAEIFSNAKKNR